MVFCTELGPVCGVEEMPTERGRIGTRAPRVEKALRNHPTCIPLVLNLAQRKTITVPERNNDLPSLERMAVKIVSGI